MGQRSQIYVRVNAKDGKSLIANHYSWNYGERMISRARHGIEAALENIKYDWFYNSKSNITWLSRVFDVNFDIGDVAISADIAAEHRNEFPEESFNEFVFLMQDNNDGKLFVDVGVDAIKYAFLDYEANLDNIMDAADYMEWNSGADWKESPYLKKREIRICEKNIAFITKHAILMTKEELREFIYHEYAQADEVKPKEKNSHEV